MANYHVTKPYGADAWHITREGAGRPERTARTEAEAEKVAHELVLSSGGGELVVHTESGPNAPGVIRKKDTLGKSDPFPPRA
jgi:hypothetical protein